MVLKAWSTGDFWRILYFFVDRESTKLYIHNIIYLTMERRIKSICECNMLAWEKKTRLNRPVSLYVCPSIHQTSPGGWKEVKHTPTSHHQPSETYHYPDEFLTFSSRSGLPITIIPLDGHSVVVSCKNAQQ